MCRASVAASAPSFKAAAEQTRFVAAWTEGAEASDSRSEATPPEVSRQAVGVVRLIVAEGDEVRVDAANEGEALPRITRRQDGPVDAGESGDSPTPDTLGLVRSLALQSGHHAVPPDGDDQSVAEAGGLAEEAAVAGVEEIEGAEGEDSTAFRACLGHWGCSRS